jgi:hypothetical protein
MGIGNFLSEAIDKVKSDITSGIEAITKPQPPAAPVSRPIAPWITNPIEDPYFKAKDIHFDRWDKIYPYRLLVVDSTNNSIISSNYGLLDRFNADPIVKSQIDGNNIVVRDLTNAWIYNLPITPQMLSIQDVYSNSNTPTLKGILEEHNGIVYKLITINGTPGVYPSRPSQSSPPQKTAVQSFFSSSIQAAGNLINSLSKLRDSFKDKTPLATEQVTHSDTGEVQIQIFQQFLEQYEILKKDPKARTYRLVLDMPKTNDTYYVTPISFSITKNAERPLESKFSLQLKAWKRIKLNSNFVPAVSKLPGLTSNTYTQALSAIRQARIVIENSVNLVRAVRSDYLVPLNAIRDVAAFIKETNGLALTVADMPNQMIKDLKSVVSDVASTMTSITNSDSNYNKVKNLQEASSLGAEGLSSEAIKNKNAGKNISFKEDSHPGYNIFNSPESSYSIFENVNLSSLKLSAIQQDKVDQEVERIRNLTIKDLKTYASIINDLSRDLSNKFGSGDATLYSILGKAPPTSRILPMSIEENEILVSLQDVINSIDQITCTDFLDSDRILNPLQYIGDQAKNNGLTFSDSSPSKILVPVPYNLSIEEISLRYLDNPERYLELVALNNLKSPFIDENGFFYDFLSNGYDRQFTLSSITNLYIGQKIKLSSLSQNIEYRTIINIEKLNSYYLISVDGLPDLDRFTLVEKAKMQAYLPGTVNSQDQIYVPVELPSEVFDGITPPSALAEEKLVALSKVDILLNENMDIAIDGYGDFRLSAGLTNLIQALKLKLFTQKGSLIAHPDYGIGLQAGMNNADFIATEVYKDIKSLILSDSRFDRIERMDISLEGPVLNLSLIVGLAGQSGIVPISFKISNK